MENTSLQSLPCRCPELRSFSGSSLPVPLREASEETCQGNLGISYLKAKFLPRGVLSVG